MQILTTIFCLGYIIWILICIAASRVEFYIGDCEEEPAKEIDLSQATYQYLGFVTLSDNQGTAFQARELKSVTLPCCGRLLKLVLHANHPNDLNVRDQVHIARGKIPNCSLERLWNLNATVHNAVSVVLFGFIDCAEISLAIKIIFRPCDSIYNYAHGRK